MKTAPIKILFISLFFLAITLSAMQEDLMVAVKSNDVTKVEQTLQLNANVGKQDNDGFTPLIYAICNFRETEILYKAVADSDNLAIVKLLLTNKADVNNSGKTGSTPLIWATQFGSPAVVELLLTNEANVNEKNSSGHGSLTCAVKRYCSSVIKEKEQSEIVHTLLQHPSIEIGEIKKALNQSITKKFKGFPEKKQINKKMLQELQETFETKAIIKIKKVAMVALIPTGMLLGIIINFWS